MPIPVSATTGDATVLNAPNSLRVSDIIARVERQFGDEANIQVEDADIIRWINDAQRELALHNNLLQARAVAGVVKGQAEYTLPLDILTVRSIRHNGQKLQPMSAQEAEERITNTTESGQPQYFWVWSQRVTLYPTPDTTITEGLQIFYSRQPASVAVATDIPELPVQYHNRIVEYCLQKAYELDENWQAAQVKGQQFQDGVNELKANVDWVERDFYPTITSLPEHDYGW